MLGIKQEACVKQLVFVITMIIKNWVTRDTFETQGLYRWKWQFGQFILNVVGSLDIAQSNA